MGMPGGWNIDHSRFARENRDPAEYLTMSYYQIWFAALETMLKERGLVADDEIAAGHALHERKPVPRVLSPGDVLKVLHRGGPTERDTNTQAAFKPGDRVRAKNIHPLTHTRLPRYVRGHVGTVERVIGFHVFPDSNARGHGENPQWLYTVAFDGDELWGAGRRPDARRCRSTPGSRIWSRSSCHSGTARRAGPGSQTIRLCLHLDSGFAASRRPGMTRKERRSTKPPPSAQRKKCPASRATPTGRCSASRGRRRPSPWRWRCTSAGCSPGRNGRQRLGAEIKRAQEAGDPDTGETYYRHWLAALERLVAEKGVASRRDACAHQARLGARLRAHAAWTCRSS